MSVPATFNMKGNAWRGMREFIEATVPGGAPAVLERLESASTREVFSTDFIPTGWYDALATDAVTRTAAELAGMSHAELCRRFGEKVLERDMNGVYRAILRFATPDLMVKSLPLASRRYFDFVTMTIEQAGPKHYLMHLSGIPELVVPTYVAVTEVFTCNAIVGSGGHNVRVTTSEPLSGTSFDDVHTVRLEREMRWD